jgi:uncharacterized protein YkwD
MSGTNQFASASLANDSDDKPAPPKTPARRVAWTLLLILGAAGLGPSSLLAAPEPPGGSQRAAHEPTLRAAAEADIPFSSDYDSAAEAMLLDLANQERSKVGAPALRLDSGLTQAARAHAEAMLAAGQLSHQLASEPSLPQRLAAATRTQLDQEAENVAFDFDAADGHRHLMLSAPHRANLLNASYNVVGIGVVHSGEQLYIVQDFGHALPAYSVAEFKDQVAAAVSLARQRAKQSALVRQDLPEVDDASCSMAKASQLRTFSVHQLAQRYTVLTYTTLRPEVLPAKASQAFSMQDLGTFSIGACYARTETYPTGAYWVLLALE